ncbi:MAG: hypothetical protein K6F62_06815 [Schwartzia sp.]|nr:hypothetical protein [Schwartzia sp. (in: firmicutes)]
MRCERCGSELNEEGRCPVCADSEENKVRVLSQDEKMNYDGVTIEEAGSYDENSGPQQDVRFERTSGPRIHYMSFGDNGSLMRKIWLFLIIAGILAFIFFIALPVALVALVVGAAVWLFFSFLG